MAPEGRLCAEKWDREAGPAGLSPTGHDLHWGQRPAAAKALRADGSGFG